MNIDRDNVYRAMYRRFGQTDTQDIEDAVSLSHIAAWQAKESGVEFYNVNAFCTCVAKRALSRSLHWQKRHVHPDRDEKLTWQYVTEVESVLQVESQCEVHVDASTVLTSAPAQYSEILRMHYMEARTLEEIAVLLNLTSECIRKRHERALKWARQFFANE